MKILKVHRTYHSKQRLQQNKIRSIPNKCILLTTGGVIIHFQPHKKHHFLPFSSIPSFEIIEQGFRKIKYEAFCCLYFCSCFRKYLLRLILITETVIIFIECRFEERFCLKLRKRLVFAQLIDIMRNHPINIT